MIESGGDSQSGQVDKAYEELEWKGSGGKPWYLTLWTKVGEEEVLYNI